MGQEARVGGGPAPAPFPYRAEIDGLRAVAVLAVIVHHLNRDWLPCGFLGVDIFFVISGYVISGSLAARGADSLASHLLTFYARRVRRLVPALAVCVLLTGLLLCLVSPAPERILETGIWSLFGLSNINLHNQATDYFGLSADLNVFTQTWSLGVEEQFYLLFPLLVWWTGGGRLPLQPGGGTAAARRRLVVALLLLSLISLGAFLLGCRLRPEAAYFLMPYRFWELGAGCLLYQGRDWRPLAALCRRLPPAIVLPALAATLLLPRQWIAAATAVGVLLTVLLLAGLERPGLVRQALRQPWLVGIGRLSYSLYLWHWSVIALSHWTIGIHPWTLPFQLVLMLALAIASYRLVERPLRQRSWSRGSAGTIGRGLAGLAGAAGTLALLAGPLQGLLYAADRQQAQDSSWIAANSLAGSRLSAEHCQRLGPRVDADCVLPPLPDHATLLLLGDSHSQHLYPMLAELRRRHGLGVVSLAPGGGEFPPLPDGRSRRSADLWTFYGRQAPRLRPGDALLLSSHIGRVAAADSPLLRQWAGRVRDLARPLASRGVLVVVVLPLPEFEAPATPYPMEACLPAWFRPWPAPGCAVRFEDGRARLRQQALRVRQQIEGVLQASPNVVLFDGFDALCPAGAVRCRSVGAEGPLFRDHSHLSRQGSLRLVEPFTALLSRQGLLSRDAAAPAAEPAQ